jgi:hypothetical protein
VLKQVGLVAAVDCVLNNWDRVPVAHNNEGNIDNWIIAEEKSDGSGSDGGSSSGGDCGGGEEGSIVTIKVTAIDFTVSPIKMEAGRAKYLERLHAVGAEIKSGVHGARYLTEVIWQKLSDRSYLTEVCTR